MTRRSFIPVVLVAIAASTLPAQAQQPAVLSRSLAHPGGHAHPGSNPHLHISNRWRECSFQLHSSLTQDAWRQFAAEAGLVTYFRPMIDARPMGKGNMELSLVRSSTAINDADAAWNDTFVHPDSTHYLFEGDALAFPGLTFRAGIGEKTDVGGYFTKAPGANYGFYGAQLQRAILGGQASAWSAATRVSFVTMFGPADLDFAVAGVDILASRTLAVKRWLTVSPYASVSGHVAMAREKTSNVDLRDEYVPGAQAAIGVSAVLSAIRIGAEYNAATVRSVSMKVGVGF